MATAHGDRGMIQTQTGTTLACGVSAVRGCALLAGCAGLLTSIAFGTTVTGGITGTEVVTGADMAAKAITTVTTLTPALPTLDDARVDNALVAAAAQVAGVAGVLHLRTGDIRLTDLVNEIGLANEIGVDDPGIEGFTSPVMLLHIPSGMNAQRRTQLEAIGAAIIAYYPTSLYLVNTAGLKRAAVAGTGFVQGAYAYQDEWKLSPVLRDVPAQTKGNIWLFNGVDGGRLAPAFAADGLRVLESERVGTTWRIAVEGNGGAFAAAARRVEVQFIEPTVGYALRNNVVTRWTVQSGISNVTPLYTAGLSGAGQIVGIIDGGLGAEHCSFADGVNPIGPLHRKILAYNDILFYSQHGTHVACTALGEWTQGGTNFVQRGVAYNAKLVMNLYPDGSESSMFSKHLLHYSQGAFIHSNSWGTDATDEYEGGCRGMDTFLRENEDALVLHAATNSAFVRNPENAKNSLCVSAGGNGTSANNVCGVGGAGPTRDGRRKPEVMGPGCSISSATGSAGCNTTTLTGTSMATPAIAGVATLAREYYVNGYYPGGQRNSEEGFVPSGALLKATIVNSAQDMSGVAGYPSVREGWGRVIADRALYFAGDARGLVVRDVRSDDPAALETNDNVTLEINVTSSAEPLRITMAYYDAPAEVNAQLTPVNNLNLVVTDPSGRVLLGNQFSNGESVTGGVADLLNNLEQVLVASPQVGEWRVEVVGGAVTFGPQGFALVASGALTEVAPCFADFNQDGGIDGTDIEVFFAAWAQSLESADVNIDGGIDGADVEAFFLAWQAGGC
jgi:hypothetical protein